MHHKHGLAKSFWAPFSWDDEWDWDFTASDPSGLSIYEEGDAIFVEASMPGMSSKDIEVYHDNGYIVLEGKKKEEKKDRKYFRKASSSFIYRVLIPSGADKVADPEASYKDGMMKLKFKKTGQKKKSIPVKEES